MRGVERQQRLFLTWGRPGSALTALVAFGIAWLVSPSDDVAVVCLLLVAVAVTAPLFVLAARRFAVADVLRIALVVDIGFIAAMIAVLGISDLLAVAYYAPIGFAALLFGPAETALYTVLGALAAVAVGIDLSVRPLTLMTNVLVLVITGTILAVLSRQVRGAQESLEREQQLDATALAIAERVRASLALDEVLGSAVEELGQAVGAARCRLRLLEPTSDTAPLYEWTRSGLSAVELRHAPFVWDVLQTGEPVVVTDLAEADPELRGLVAEELGGASFLAHPITVGGRVLAAIVFVDDQPRQWQHALPLVRRVVPQLGAAIGQAQSFERLSELTRLREELVANVSHELRTPLTSTIGFLQTLEREELQQRPDQLRQLLTVARREAERLARLVDDLLQLTRLERGTLPLEPAEVDLVELTERAAASQVVPAGRVIQLELPDELPLVADGDRLLQVLTNLLSNALRHGAGTVAVAAAGDDDQVEVAVSDDGPGVPSDHVDAVFLPFARWGAHAEGTGLGLAISRRIVEAHGGALRYRPAAEASPHAFVIELPREAAVTAHRWRRATTAPRS
ncbi:MAG TPA: ATP-binding protein [Gaiellaceae bacterium]